MKNGRRFTVIKAFINGTEIPIEQLTFQANEPIKLRMTMTTMTPSLQHILAAAQAIMAPNKPPKKTATSERTYYLWETGRVSQRRPPRGIFFATTTRAKTTSEALENMLKKGFIMAYKEK
jgi:hypothetical protein